MALGVRGWDRDDWDGGEASFKRSRKIYPSRPQVSIWRSMIWQAKITASRRVLASRDRVGRLGYVGAVSSTGLMR